MSFSPSYAVVLQGFGWPGNWQICVYSVFQSRHTTYSWTADFVDIPEYVQIQFSLSFNNILVALMFCSSSLKDKVRSQLHTMLSGNACFPNVFVWHRDQFALVLVDHWSTLPLLIIYIHTGLTHSFGRISGILMQIFRQFELVTNCDWSLNITGSLLEIVALYRSNRSLTGTVMIEKLCMQTSFFAVQNFLRGASIGLLTHLFKFMIKKKKTSVVTSWYR